MGLTKCFTILWWGMLSGLTVTYSSYEIDKNSAYHWIHLITELSPICYFQNLYHLPVSRFHYTLKHNITHINPTLNYYKINKTSNFNWPFNNNKIWIKIIFTNWKYHFLLYTILYQVMFIHFQIHNCIIIFYTITIRINIQFDN